MLQTYIVHDFWRKPFKEKAVNKARKRLIEHERKIDIQRGALKFVVYSKLLPYVSVYSRIATCQSSKGDSSTHHRK